MKTCVSMPKQVDNVYNGRKYAKMRENKRKHAKECGNTCYNMPACARHIETYEEYATLC